MSSPKYLFYSVVEKFKFKFQPKRSLLKEILITHSTLNETLMVEYF